VQASKLRRVLAWRLALAARACKETGGANLTGDSTNCVSQMDEGLRQVIGLLAVAMMVAIVAHRFKLPYTVGLVAIGAFLTFGRVDVGRHLTHDLIFDLILPPLLFEAALALHWDELRRDMPPILLFATLGTVISAAAIAVAMTALLGWPLVSAIVFGALIAATDPVAIIAMFKDNKVGGRLRLLVESESLLNDGAATVLFGLSLAWAQSQGAGWTAADVFATLARVVIGGVGVGAICGALAVFVAGRATDHLIEAALTTVAAFGSFLIAEYLDASGVLATVTTGLIIGNLGGAARDQGPFLTDKGREFITSLWEFAAFLANSIVFLLIGVDTAQALVGSYGAGTLLASAGIVLAGRALTVYPLSLVFRGTQWALSLKEQHILWWSGLRGALSIALALSLPETLPLRADILVVTFAVVAVSIVVQGLTMPALLRRTGLPRS
jgi:monovalent cation:H+ antiporter, CPA1 family